jgi:glucose/arabinose dehydrogenase
MQKNRTQICVLAVIMAMISATSQSQVVSSRMKEVFLKKDLAAGTNGTADGTPDRLLDPWEILYGPDGYLWATEAKGYKVYRINTSTGERSIILDISPTGTGGGLTASEHTAFNRQNWTNTPSIPWPQGGLMGMALHPDFNHPTNPKKLVYLAYVKSQGSVPTDNTGQFYTNYLVRFNYDEGTNQLTSPVALCDTLPGSKDHNSGRMIIAPVNGVNYLFYASGDMGAGQFENRYRVQKAQVTGSYEGKILRFNLEGDITEPTEGAYKKWIPNDNPYNSSGNPPTTQSAVWAIGMRNNQGFAYANLGGTDYLYGSSHGPWSDDEINIIEKKKNYGHPLVVGMNDGNYNGYAAGFSIDAAHAGTGCPIITSESGNVTAINTLLADSYRNPIFSGYDSTHGVKNASIGAIWNISSGNGAWPSEGWSGMDIYTNSTIPGWKNSLLLTSLKWGRMLRFKLNSTFNGMANIGTVGAAPATADTLSYWGSNNRFRDVALSPDGKDIFLVMDNSLTTSGPTAGNDVVPDCQGCIQKYTFLGYNDNAGASTIPTSIPIAPGTDDDCEIFSPVVINADNTNIWVPITDANSNIVAEIKANGNLIGTVNTKLYKNGGAVRFDPAGKPYLDRNLAISVTGTPPFNTGGGVDVRIYITSSEFNALDLEDAGITSFSNLGIFKTSGYLCQPEINGAASKVTGTTVAAFGSQGYVIKGTVNSFSSFFVANNSLTILPVVLKEINANWIGNQASVSWSTASETNTASFDVERSTDGRTFSTVGNIEAKGNSNVMNSYRFNDATVVNAASPIFYYRLNVKSIDGRSNYSKVVSLSRGGNSFYVRAYPNPVKSSGTLVIFSDKDEIVTWQVTDVSGRTLRSQINQISKGQNNININMNSIPAGIYQLVVKGQHFTKTLKLQKQ